jgi:branched-chain amino acid transport system substrate-binding protein
MGIALLVIGLLVGAGVTYVVAPGKTGSGTTTGLSGTIPIGALLDLSGQLSDFGTREKVAATMAVNDVNAYLAASGSSVKFNLLVQDTGSDPAKALQALQALQSQGVQVFAGPLSSGEASNILQTANSNHLVLISQSSTAISLAIPGDYLFRLIPNDGAQSLAIARELQQKGYTDVVIVQRHDTYGDGLANATLNRFKALGGNAEPIIQYSTTATDYGPTVSQILSEYQTAVGKVGASKVAIVAIAFDEAGQILLKAESAAPQLMSATWYGSDGEATSTIIANSTTGSGQAAAQVHLYSSIYAPASSDKFSNFTARYMATANQTPDPYSASVYDCVWVGALSILAAGKNDGAAVVKVLPTVANNYYGVSGWTELQPSGDLAPTLGYDIWSVTVQNGTPTWEISGHWDPGSDKVTGPAFP